MTPEQIEFHRKRFEEWCKDNGHNTDDLCGNYLNLNTYKAWIVWIAAIKSIEIEVPEAGPDKNDRYDLGFNRCLGWMKFNIQSLGIKIKERQ